MDSHQSVLQQEAVTALNIRDDGCYLDGTFGRGGHSEAIIAQLGPHGRLFAIDRDLRAIEYAQERVSLQDRSFNIWHGRFSQLDEFMQSQQMMGKLQGVLFDFGVSSPQLDDAERGFSFKNDGPLDMRMNRSEGITAAQWIATATQQQIADALYRYGDEKYSRRIARRIVEAREQEAITTTARLADLIRQTVPKSRDQNKDSATRSFQAIRIVINQELEEIELGLKKAVDALAIGGRLVVISFHSLEHRLVKVFFREQSRGDHFPRGLPVTQDQMKTPCLKVIGKPVYPSETEIERNPRARSAVLRVAEKQGERL